MKQIIGFIILMIVLNSCNSHGEKTISQSAIESQKANIEAIQSDESSLDDQQKSVKMSQAKVEWYMNGTVKADPFTSTDGRIFITLGPSVSSVYLKTQGTTAYNKLKGGWHKIAPGTYVPGLMGVNSGMIWATIDYK